MINIDASLKKMLGKKKGLVPGNFSSNVLGKIISKPFSAKSFGNNSFTNNNITANVLGKFKLKKFGGKKDFDFDGVINKFDCQPKNTMRQHRYSNVQKLPDRTIYTNPEGKQIIQLKGKPVKGKKLPSVDDVAYVFDELPPYYHSPKEDVQLLTRQREAEMEAPTHPLKKWRNVKKLKKDLEYTHAQHRGYFPAKTYDYAKKTELEDRGYIKVYPVKGYGKKYIEREAYGGWDDKHREFKTVIKKDPAPTFPKVRSVVVHEAGHGLQDSQKKLAEEWEEKVWPHDAPTTYGMTSYKYGPGTPQPEKEDFAESVAVWQGTGSTHKETMGLTQTRKDILDKHLRVGRLKGGPSAREMDEVHKRPEILAAVAQIEVECNEDKVEEVIEPLTKDKDGDGIIAAADNNDEDENNPSGAHYMINKRPSWSKKKDKFNWDKELQQRVPNRPLGKGEMDDETLMRVLAIKKRQRAKEEQEIIQQEGIDRINKWSRENAKKYKDDDKPWQDKDKDGIINEEDCDKDNPKKQGFFHGPHPANRLPPQERIDVINKWVGHNVIDEKERQVILSNENPNKGFYWEQKPKFKEDAEYYKRIGKAVWQNYEPKEGEKIDEYYEQPTIKVVARFNQGRGNVILEYPYSEKNIKNVPGGSTTNIIAGKSRAVHFSSPVIRYKAGGYDQGTFKEKFIKKPIQSPIIQTADKNDNEVKETVNENLMGDNDGDGIPNVTDPNPEKKEEKEDV